MTALLNECTVLETRGSPADVDVRAVEHDSRRVSKDTLFFCLPGSVTDGHDHVNEAVERGAVGLVCERPVELPGRHHVVQARVPPGSARSAMARAAAALYGHPARQLLMAGVTGTNGKTTVTHLLAEVLGRAGRPTTVVGTLSGSLTTPESPELQSLLARVRDESLRDGVRHAVSMEVSSHALAQHRVDAIRFDVAVFTNLSHDHLDFHGSMEEYWHVKASLFTAEHAALGVVCADDPFGERLLRASPIPLVAVSRDAASEVTTAPGRTCFTWNGQRIELALTGEVNVTNALLAAEAAVAAGVDTATAARALDEAPPVPGRMEVVWVPSEGRGPPFTVLVDYAHTPASLERVLHDARRLAEPGRRVLVTFGCGGERDVGKRPLMGAVAARDADVVVVTTDNPRGEPPAVIADDVVAGMPTTTSAHVSTDLDRRRAIETVLETAEAGDVVVVAGKGHEAYQVRGSSRHPFDDREVVREVLAGVRTAGSSGRGGR